MSNSSEFHAVIPAGGIGSRLWPLSRASAPKFLHDLTGSGQTLLQDTWDRLSPIAGADIMVVTGSSHASAVADQLPELRPENLLLEPSPRDSTAAIALAAAVLYRRNPDVIIGSFAADHVIHETEKFEIAVREAIEVAKTGRVVTIGVAPTEASTAFGYINTSNEIDGFDSALNVIEFVEKPSIAKAKKYFSKRDYLWNAGMFIAPAKLLLEVLAENEPELEAEIQSLADQVIAGGFDQKAVQQWNRLKKVAIDYSVAEPAAKRDLVACVPASFEWHDVGDFAAIAELQSQGKSGNLAVLGQAKVLSDSSSGILVSENDKLIALIGVEDIIVVDTPDALLVTTKQHAQRVKGLVDSLRATGQDEVL
ncbi:MAG: mannose-1-phosphate guanylyltransferase [Microbacteriaceae bacterium]|nr:mannose-1-phosphate guanylyltransferase [Microbacteriaceae bacterium]